MYYDALRIEGWVADPGYIAGRPTSLVSRNAFWDGRLWLDILCADHVLDETGQNP